MAYIHCIYKLLTILFRWWEHRKTSRKDQLICGSGRVKFSYFYGLQFQAVLSAQMTPSDLLSAETNAANVASELFVHEVFGPHMVDYVTSLHLLIWAHGAVEAFPFQLDHTSFNLTLCKRQRDWTKIFYLWPKRQITQRHRFNSRYFIVTTIAIKSKW